MTKQYLISIYKTLIFIIFSIFWFLSIANGQSIYQSKENLDSFNVKDASQTIRDLEWSIENITKQLYELDNKEVWIDWDLSEKYREIRSEIVSVIQDINYTTDYVGTMLQKISVYKKQIFLNAKQLKETRAWLESTKVLIEKFTNFFYKLNNQIFDEDGIDDFKLFASSNNIPLSLSNEYMVKYILIQFNNLIENLDTDEDKQIKLIKTLNELKLKASKDVVEYQVILDTLHQKKIT